MTAPNAAEASGSLDASRQFDLTQLADLDPALEELPAYLRLCADLLDDADALQRLTILTSAAGRLKAAVTAAGVEAVHQGSSVAAVGRAAGMSRQAAHQRWAEAAAADEAAAGGQGGATQAEARGDVPVPRPPAARRTKVEDVTVRLPGLPGKLSLRIERSTRRTSGTR